MKASRTLGTCTVILIALGMAFSASASATLPEIGRCVAVAKGSGEYGGPTCTTHSLPGKGVYKWEEGAGEKKKFSGSLETTTFQTVGGKKIVCAATIIEGAEYTGAKTASFPLDIKGCELVATKQTCQNSPSPTAEGEIETTVTGEIGFIRTVMPIVGWDLKGWNVTVTCGKLPETNISTDKIEGSVIGSVAKTGKMLTEETLKFRQTAGKQNPEHFEGQPNDVLTSEWTEGVTKTTEQTGFSTFGPYENEEPLEIKTKCMENHEPCK